MKSKLVISSLFLFLASAPFTLLKSQISLQDSIYNLYIEFLNSKNESARTDNSKRFSDGLKYALQKDSKAILAFDSLKKYKVMIESPDKKVKIFTWSIRSNDFTYIYYGIMHVYNRKQKKYEVYELKDKSATIQNPENAILDNTKWYGAYYYQIIENKYKNKYYYTLLGWDGNNQNTNKKLVDVLTLNDKGLPKFGDAIFYDEKGKINKRLIFEYKAGVIVSFKYDEEKKGIIFDHLSASDPSLEGIYSFYGPDFTYDMLHFEGGKWVYVKNVNARNPKEKTDKYYNEPK